MHACGYCESYFDKKEQRTSHRIQCHSECNGKEGYCSFCNEQFQTYFNFLDHFDEVHPEERGNLIERNGPNDGSYKEGMNERDKEDVMQSDKDGDGVELSRNGGERGIKEKIVNENEVECASGIGNKNESPRPNLEKMEEVNGHSQTPASDENEMKKDAENSNPADQLQMKSLITPAKPEDVYKLYHEEEEDEADESTTSSRKRDHSDDSSSSSSLLKKPRGLSTRDPNIPHSKEQRDLIPSCDSDDDIAVLYSPTPTHNPIVNEQLHPMIRPAQPVFQPQLQPSYYPSQVPIFSLHHHNMAQAQSTQQKPFFGSVATPPLVPMNNAVPLIQSGQQHFMNPCFTAHMKPMGSGLSPSFSGMQLSSPVGSLGSSFNGMNGTFINPHAFSPYLSGMNSLYFGHSQHNATANPSVNNRDTDFVNGKGPNICPQCTYPTSSSKKDRVNHYLHYHFGIYFTLNRMNLPEVERWLSIHLGVMGEGRENVRLCPHCVNIAWFEGRIQLLRHIQERHANIFFNLEREYLEKFVKRGTQSSNVTIHNLLIFDVSYQ